MNTPDYKYISFSQDLPTCPHYAVIVDNSFQYISGYEHDRSFYDATHEGVQYISFFNKKALEDWILKNQNKKFKVIHVTPQTVNLETTVKLSVV